MNTNLINKTTSAGLVSAFGMLSSAFAIERPGQEKSEKLPPEVIPFSVQQASPKPVQAPQQEKRAWLGVRTEAIHPDLAWHLKLDSGVIVREVDPTSPAAEAGLKARDIILKIGELAVQNRGQVKAAIVSHQPGQEVKIKVQRQGEIVDLKVVLGSRDALPAIPLAADRLLDRQLPGFAGGMLPGGLDQETAARLHEQLLKRVEDALKSGPGQQAQGQTLNLQDLLNGAIPQAGKDFHLGIQSSGSFSLSDENGTVEMTIEDGNRQVKVTGPEGEVLFEGPYTTEADKAAVAEEYRERIEALGVDGPQGSGFRFQFIAPDEEAEPEKK